MEEDKTNGNSTNFISNIIEEALSAAFLGIFGSFIVGAGTLLYQIFIWLKNGVWVSMPIIKIFQLLNVNLDSIYNPKDWIGLANAITVILNTEIFYGIPIIGIVLGFLAISILLFFD